MFMALFWSVKIDLTFPNLAWLLSFGIVGDQVWTTLGFFIGLAIPDEGGAAKIMLVFVCKVFQAVNGGIVNPSKSNLVVETLSKTTPGRYVTEGFFRSLTQKVNYTVPIWEPKVLGIVNPINFSEDQAGILEIVGYDFGRVKCMCLLYVWMAVFMIGCVIAIMIKYGRI